MNNININDIIIPKRFLNSKVKSEKIHKKKKLIQGGHNLIIALNDNNTLTDGYAAYLAYKQLGYTEVEFIRGEGKKCKRIDILTRDNCECYICNRKLPNKELTIDHVIPLAKGGSNDESNLRCCCYLCNNLKADFTLSDKLIDVIKDELKERGVL